MLQAASVMIGGFLISESRHQMMQWQTNVKSLDVASWQDALDSALLAAKYDRLNTEYIYDIGRLYEWRANQYPVWSDDARLYRSIAIEYFRKSVQARPVWPQAQIQLAISKILNLEADTEAENAFDAALKYGPWEYGVHERIIWFGIAMWDQLPQETRVNVKNLVNESIRLHRGVNYINNIKKQFNWQENAGA